MVGQTPNLETFGPKPADYAGFWPDEDDWLVMVRTRGAHLIEQSNYETARACLQQLQDKLLEELRKRRLNTCGHTKRAAIDEQIRRTADALIEWRVSHFACGWMEYLGLKRSAPQEMLRLAEQIIKSIEGYPVLDEDDYSRRVTEAADEFWADLDEEERRSYASDAGVELTDEELKQDACPSSMYDAIGAYDW